MQMPFTGVLYWANFYDKVIQKAFILHENARTADVSDVTAQEFGRFEVGGLVGDWEAQRLYWTNTGLHTHRHVHALFNYNAVSMCFNLSFISGASKIEYFDLESNTLADLLSSNVMHPTSLTFDSRSKTLYWIDKG